MRTFQDSLFILLYLHIQNAFFMFEELEPQNKANMNKVNR